MRNWRIGAMAGVAGLMVACGGGADTGDDTTVPFREGVENAALANPEVRETSNSNALATLYRTYDRSIQRAQLATERASNPAMRQLAQGILDERARLTLEATGTARTLGVDFTTALDTIPTATPTTAIADVHAEAMERLRGATGAAFDTTWVQSERRVTRESLDQLAAFNDPTMDSTVTRLVGETRTVLQRELAQLQQLLGGG